MNFFFSCLASSKWLTEKKEWKELRASPIDFWVISANLGTAQNISCCAASIIAQRIKPSLKSTKKVNPDFQREQNWFHRQKHITVFSASRCALKRLHQYLEQDADSEQYPGPCWVSALGRTNTNNYYSDFIWYPLNGTLLSFSSIVAVMQIWRVGFDF